MPTVEFETKDSADVFRDRYEDHLCPDDDKRYKRVVFKSGTPEDVIEETVQAIRDGLRHIDFPEPMRIRDLGDEFRLFVSEPDGTRLKSDYHPDWRQFEPTGGDGGDPDAMFRADQLEWDTPNPAIERPAPSKERARKMATATHRDPADRTPEEKAETLREAAEILETEGGGQMDLFGNEKQASGQARLAGGETGEVETEIDRETNQGGIMADTRSEVSSGATETRQRHLSGSPEDADQGQLTEIQSDGGQVNYPKDHLEEMALYLQDEIVMHDVQDQNLETATRAAFDAVENQEGSTVSIGSTHLAELADYIRDEIVMYDRQDPALEEAVSEAYDTLEGDS